VREFGKALQSNLEIPIETSFHCWSYGSCPLLSTRYCWETPTVSSWTKSERFGRQDYFPQAVNVRRLDWL